MGLKGEKCGVFGIRSYGDTQVIKLIYSGLFALQHRGQESAGISVFNGEKIITHKNMGTVGEVFHEQEMQNLFGTVGIGHVRYSTTGESSLWNAQPFFLEAPKMGIAISLNGNITNYQYLRDQLERKGHVFVSSIDTEIIARLFAIENRKTDDLFKVMHEVMSKLEGAYSILILTQDGKIIGARDPFGFKPLCVGRGKNFYVFASEEPAIDAANAFFVRNIKPGEVMVIGDTIESKIVHSSKRKARCMFEWVYFSRPDSYFDEISVYKVREKLGRLLAKMYPVEADAVIPVPESGRIAALSYANESGIPYKEGLMKNKYVHRTFILPVQAQRESVLKLKLNPIKEVIEDARIVLVDDSIVRGTTMRRTIELLKNAGAKEVHLRITCPPLISPCYMGVDFATKKELIATKKSMNEIKDFLHATSLGYITVDGLIEAIGLDKDQLCLGCVTGDYPLKQISNLTRWTDD